MSKKYYAILYKSGIFDIGRYNLNIHFYEAANCNSNMLCPLYDHSCKGAE